MRRGRLETDAGFGRLVLELGLTEQLQLGEAHGEAGEQDAAADQEHAAARWKLISPVAAHRLATLMLAGMITKRTSG